MVPFRTAFAGYSYNQQNFSRELAVSHPELTMPMLAGILNCFVNRTRFQFVFTHIMREKKPNLLIKYVLTIILLLKGVRIVCLSALIHIQTSQENRL